MIKALAGARCLRRCDGADRLRWKLDPEIQKLWSDPEFKKQFLGTYGIHADIEPKVSPEERAVLEKVYPLLGSDSAAAAKLLETAATSEATALFDFILGNLAFQDDRDADAMRRGTRRR